MRLPFVTFPASRTAPAAAAATLAALLAACGPPPPPQPPALVVSDRGGALRVYAIDVADGSARLVGSPRADDRSYADDEPALLPGGGIVFVSGRAGRDTLYVADGPGDAARPVFGERPAEAADSDPAPAGPGRIVFARADGGDAGAPAPRELYAARLDGGDLRRLTRHPADDGAPCLFPDGRTVVFVSTRAGAPRLFRLDAAAADPESTVAPLLPAETGGAGGPDGSAPGVADGAPACLPDGGVLFSRSVGDAPSQIALARPGSARLRQITDALTLPHGASEPVVLGDGRILLTTGPAPGVAGRARYAVYRISEGGYNLARVSRDGILYDDRARRLRDPR